MTIGPVHIYWNVRLITMGRVQIARSGPLLWRWIYDEPPRAPWVSGYWRTISFGWWHVRWIVRNPSGHDRPAVAR